MKTIAIFLVALVASPAFADEIHFREVSTAGEWQEAVRAASQEDKSIFVDYYATWCGPCKMLDRDVFSDDQVGEFFNSEFINVKIDGETVFGEEFGAMHQVSAYPTMFFFASDQVLLNKIVGFYEGPQLVREGEKALESGTLLPELQKKYEAGKLSTLEKARYYALLPEAQRPEQLEAEIYAELGEEELVSQDYIDFLQASTNDLDDKGIEVIANQMELIRAEYGQQWLDDILGPLFNQTLGQAIEEQDEELLKKILDVLVPIYVDEEADIANGRYVTKKLYLSYTGEWEQYGKLVEANHDAENRVYYYSEAEELIDDFAAAPGAQGLIEKWIAKSRELEGDDFELNYLNAYYHAMTGDRDAALAACEQAEDKARNDEQLMAIQEFREVLTGSY